MAKVKEFGLVTDYITKPLTRDKMKKIRSDYFS
jgi:hypothetical protein